ncbi:MAG: tetratricopeptide repeat protein, partial [Proteobacteria bacterium]|nr:tetratricopeptide repeat protein [Pseudomonadota bacterium]
MLSLAAAGAVLLNSRRRAWRTTNLLLATGLVIGIIGWLHQVTQADSIFGSGIAAGADYFGTFVNHNHGGIACGALVPLAVAAARITQKRRYVYLGAAALLILAAWSTQSRNATISALIGLLVIGLLDKQRRIKLSTLAVCAIMAATIAIIGPTKVFEEYTQVIQPEYWEEGDLTGSRTQTYRDTMGMIGAAPLVGVGHGSFGDGFKTAKTNRLFTSISQAHSDVLQLGAEHGVPIAIIWIGLATLIWGTGIRRVWQAEQGHHRGLTVGYLGATASLGTFSLFDFPMRIGALAVLGAILIGQLTALGTKPSLSASQPMQRGFQFSAVVMAACALLAMVFALAMKNNPSSAFGSSSLTIEKGDQLWHEKKPAEALAMYKRALAQRPFNQNALLRLARTQWALEDELAALESLETAAAIYPTLPFPWLTLGRLNHGIGRHDDALEAYAHLLSLSPQDFQQFKDWLLESLTLPKDPVEVVLAVLAERPEQMCHAAVLVAKDDREAAELLFLIAISSDSNCKTAFAQQLDHWGRTEEALEMIAGSPDSCNSLRNLGYILLNLRRPQQAIPKLEKALRLCGSDNAMVRLLLARARLGTNDQTGLPMLEQLTKTDPSTTNRRELYRALLKFGQTSKAIDQLEHLVESKEATEQEKELLQILKTNTRLPTMYSLIEKR